MSLYAIHKFLVLLRNDGEFRLRVQTDPKAVLDSLRLTAEERSALERGDVHTLYEMGAHAYLLQQLANARLFGLSRGNYMARIRGEEAVSR